MFMNIKTSFSNHNLFASGVFDALVAKKSRKIAVGLACLWENGAVKSVNMQNNTLVRWSDGTKDSSTKHLMFQVLFFFIKSCKIICKNCLHLFLLFFYKLTKIKSFECPKSMRNYKENNAWIIRCLVNESFVSRNQPTSVWCCRLSDL